MEISEKLLSEVLELDVTNYKYPSFGTYIDYSKLYVIYKKENIEYSLLVNIYELAHKCKVWAYNQGYYLTIYNDAIDVVLQSNCKVLENVTNDTFMYDPNLVFKACQWILDNKEG